jgi:alpha-mannosidase
VSLRRRADADSAVEVRVVNMSAQPTVAVLGSDAVPVTAAALVDGRGGDQGGRVTADGRDRVPLRPWEIAAVRVDIGAPLRS